MRPTIRTLIATGAAAALVAAPSAAFAGERPDHAGHQDGGSAWTEDDDTNDGTPNNVEDDGDNAHPSGRDRSIEHGESGNQGKAKSDPDDDGRGPDRSNVGPDQPNGSGGVDQADQDGNNGCGNDDDFEDDNEGWCGKPHRDTSPESSAAPAPQADDAGERSETESSGDTASGGEGATADTTVSATCPATSVTVTSTKDLSNVVLVFADGDHQKFEGLSGSAGTFAGTGDDAGERIVRVYVKSGANASGEGPGYGERHEVACSASPTTSGVAAIGSSTPTTPATTAGPPAVDTGVLGKVIERPAAPTSILGAPAGDVIAAGGGVLSVGVPGSSAAVDTLPRSGVDAGPAALAGVLALLGGVLAVRRTRSV